MCLLFFLNLFIYQITNSNKTLKRNCIFYGKEKNSSFFSLIQIERTSLRIKQKIRTETKTKTTCKINVPQLKFVLFIQELCKQQEDYPFSNKIPAYARKEARKKIGVLCLL